MTIKKRRPHWHDCCEHPKGSYIGTIEDTASGTIDVYVYPDSFHGCSVCLRYGSEGPQYISPGGLGWFLRAAGIHEERAVLKADPRGPGYSRDAYCQAAELIINQGVFTFKLREGNHG